MAAVSLPRCCRIGRRGLRVKAVALMNDSTPLPEVAGILPWLDRPRLAQMLYLGVAFSKKTSQYLGGILPQVR